MFKLSNNFKKNLIQVICLTIALSPVFTYAASSGRAANLQSKGVVKYTDGNSEIVIDSNDLVTLANQIDTLEKDAKLGQVQALQTLPGVAQKNNLTAINESNIGNVSFSQINNAIKSSQASSNAPLASEIVSGKSVWANGNNITGTMPNNGATGKANLTAGTSYTIPAGYTTGGTVTTATLASQTQGTATAANLSSGVTAWVNGTKITGTGADNNSYYALGKSENNYNITVVFNYDRYNGTGQLIEQNVSLGTINIYVRNGQVSTDADFQLGIYQEKYSGWLKIYVTNISITSA